MRTVERMKRERERCVTHELSDEWKEMKKKKMMMKKKKKENNGDNAADRQAADY